MAVSAKRGFASILDTALLVFFVLAVLAVGWWVLKAVLVTVWLFAKLAILALLIAGAIRAYIVLRRRLN